MKVSILITTYNLEKYIRTTLDSVIGQKTDYEYEILVGDDGSSDSTVDIINEYVSRFPGVISLYQMPREEGVEYNRVERSAANRINLLSHAEGEYISFLDGDDFYTSKNRIDEMVKILDDPANSSCVMCAHNLVMYYDKGETLSTPFVDDVTALGEPLCRAIKRHTWALKDYWPAIFIQANAFMIRNLYKHEEAKNLLLNTPALMSNFDDNNIIFWAFTFGKMYYIPDCHGAYRQIEGSSWNGIDELKKHCSNIIGYAVEQQVNPLADTLSETRHYMDFSYLYLRMKDLNEENCMPFYKTAKDLDLKTALYIYNLPNMDQPYIDEYRKMMERSCNSLEGFKRRRALKKLFKRY